MRFENRPTYHFLLGGLTVVVEVLAGPLANPRTGIGPDGDTNTPVARQLLGILGDAPIPTIAREEAGGEGSSVANGNGVVQHVLSTATTSANGGRSTETTATTATTRTTAQQNSLDGGSRTAVTTGTNANSFAAYTSTSSSSLASPSSGSLGYAAAEPTPPGELVEWKVIGISVITITFIATVILAIAFFDSWWGFLQAAICGRGKGKGRKGRWGGGMFGHGGEEMVPDWEKRSWEFRLATEDGHRYPTMSSSLDSIAKEKRKDREKDKGLALGIKMESDQGQGQTQASKAYLTASQAEQAYGGISTRG